MDQQVYFKSELKYFYVGEIKLSFKKHFSF